MHLDRLLEFLLETFFTQFIPLIPMSVRISSYNINTESSRQVMRIRKNVIKEIISWSKTKLSNYCNIIRITWQTPRRIAKWRSWEWKGYCIAYSYSYWFLVSMAIVCLLVNLANTVSYNLMSLNYSLPLLSHLLVVFL